MVERTFKPGEDVYVASDSPVNPHSVSFEDNGETGYFYALDLNRSNNMIVDALHIYNVADVTDRDRSSTLSMKWSFDGLKCALLINGYPHAVFDFSIRRGFCRTNFPNFSTPSEDCWTYADHTWSDDAIAWLE